MTKAYNNSLLARNITVSGVNTSVSGLLSATSGNFIDSLQVNNINVSVSGHTHTASNISDSTTAGRALLTATDAATQRTNLGLGTIATEPSGNYSLSSHTHTSSSITDFNSSVSGLLPVTNITAGNNINISSSSGNFTINSIPLISYTTTASFPASGSTNSYYLATDSSRIYQWTGSQYVETGPGSTTVSANDPTAGLTLLHPFLLGGM